MARAALVTRWVLAGPISLIAAILIMASTPLWMPQGGSGVDNIVFALVLFPAYWAAAFFYVLIEQSMARASAVMVVVLAVSAFAIFRAFTAA
ncbi:MAG: hypothetical protein AAFX85_11590 [Pseudomonadota bacterium]